MDQENINLHKRTNYKFKSSLIWADAFIFGLKNIEKYIIYVLFKKKKKKRSKNLEKHVRRIYRMSARLCLSLS
jgi:hypothetical protein